MRDLRIIHRPDRQGKEPREPFVVRNCRVNHPLSYFKYANGIGTSPRIWPLSSMLPLYSRMPFGPKKKEMFVSLPIAQCRRWWSILVWSTLPRLTDDAPRRE